MSWLRAVFPEDSAVSLKDGDVAVPFISLHVQCLLEMSMLRFVRKERRDPNTRGGLLSLRGGTASVSNTQCSVIALSCNGLN